MIPTFSLTTTQKPASQAGRLSGVRLSVITAITGLHAARSDSKVAGQDEFEKLVRMQKTHLRRLAERSIGLDLCNDNLRLD